MKKFIAFLLLSTLTSAVVIPNQTFQKVENKKNPQNQESIGYDTFNQMEGFKINDLEKKLGRKMSLTEKASFFFDKRGTIENLFTKSEKEKRNKWTYNCWVYICRSWFTFSSGIIQYRWSRFKCYSYETGKKK